MTLGRLEDKWHLVATPDDSGPGEGAPWCGWVASAPALVHTQLLPGSSPGLLLLIPAGGGFRAVGHSTPDSNGVLSGSGLQLLEAFPITRE